MGRFAPHFYALNRVKIRPYYYIYRLLLYTIFLSYITELKSTLSTSY